MTMILLLTYLILNVSNARAFTSPANNLIARHRDTNILNSYQSQMNLLADPYPFTDLTRTDDMQLVNINLDSTGMIISSQHEAQIFGDMAHFLLDFATLCTPEIIIIRLLILLGRIFSILSDYVPDHTMTTDELFFQFSMLAIATKMFLEKLTTTISSLKEDTSFQDRRIYKSIFSPAGFTWIQYRTLLASHLLEWNHYRAGSIIRHDEDSLLITYKGIVEKIENSPPSSSRRRKRFGMIDGKYCHDIIGDFARPPDFFSDFKNKRPIEDNNNTEDHRKAGTFLAGLDGVTILRLDMKKVVQYASEEDIGLCESLKNLYFTGMQKVLISYSVPLTQDDAYDGHKNDTDVHDGVLYLNN